jgi:hypothetical protein
MATFKEARFKDDMKDAKEDAVVERTRRSKTRRSTLVKLAIDVFAHLRFEVV